jgi:hypothetical protein
MLSVWKKASIFEAGSKLKAVGGCFWANKKAYNVFVFF